MTYATLLESEGIVSQYLVVIKPRRLVTSWTLVSGTKYTSSFSYGEVRKLTSNGVEQTLAASSSVASGEFFFDVDTNTLYLDLGVNPNTKTVVVTYELFFGTYDAHFYRDPLDSATRQVYYEPLVTKSPEVKSSVSDSLFGFLPSVSSSISLSNATQYLQAHLYDSSFYKAEINVYHYLDKLTVANTSLITAGVCGNVSYNDQETSITIFDKLDLFDINLRQDLSPSYYAESDFPNLDPNFFSRPIRKVYGVVDGFLPVNIDYVEEEPTTSDNRIWIAIGSDNLPCSISTTVPVSPTSTTTRTYLTSVDGFRVGDNVWIDSSAGAAFDEYPIINLVGANYIEHLAVTNAAVSASVVKRSYVGNCKIMKEGVLYQPLFGRDYSEYIDATNKVLGFEFTTTLEANLGLATNLTPSDLVFIRIYGNKNSVSHSGGAFGGNSTTTGNLTNGIIILFDLLHNFLGVPFTELDEATFISAASAITDELGFAIPHSATDDFPSFKDLIIGISQTLLLKVFLNTNNKFTIVQTAPLGSIDKTIQDDEVLRGSFRYAINYDDVYSNLFVQYSGREVNSRNEVGEYSYQIVGQNNTVSKYLHSIDKQKTFTSLHFIESEAQTLVDRLNFALGDRRGTIFLNTKNRFFNSQINDVIAIDRSRMLGFTYDSSVNNSKSTAILSTSKSLTEIELELDDQKGIEDNSGGW